MDIPQEFRVQYIERRQSDLQSCLEAIQKSEFGTLERIGHQIKGNATSFGFDELATIGELLEDAAKKQDLARAEDITKNFQVYLLAAHKFI